MHGKYAVIGLLLVGLGILVAVLLRVERRRARPEVVQVIEPAPQPVELAASREEIEAAARQARVRFRCAGDEFEHLTLTSNARGEKTETWQKLFVVGANLGVALPGRYPTEFAARREDYARWLEQMGAAGVNVVRAYTILPPEFYQALAEYGFRHTERPVFLLQGIWAELPASGNLFDPAYSSALKREIRDAVDVVAGRAVLPARPGSATGAYSADVSPFTLGYVFGREWEPEAVEATDSANPAVLRYDGVLVNVPRGSPTEVWLAGMLDFLAQYEAVTYATQHPVAFVNWLPLDPMFHPTEYADRWRTRESDNDIVTVDPRSIQTTPALRAGYFAAYHVYPYYPDFVFLDSAYRSYCDPRGEPDNYAGYLSDLKRHHAGLPLLVAEFGVPSSRGNAHHNWLGMDHGGHSESEQARLDLRMLSAIHDKGCAGGVIFAWLDEWFKRNWLVDEFEVPPDRTRLWHNVQNPEQCFGLVKFGRELVAIDGETDDWPGRPVARGGEDIRAIWLAADEEYLYVRLDLARPPDWSSRRIGLAIDTYDPRLGNRRLGPLGLDCANGAEFLVLLDDTSDAQVFVDSTYSPFLDPNQPGRRRLRMVANSDGAFVPERLVSNYPRFTAEGETIPVYVTEYGRLRFGRSADNTLADWYTKDSVVEMRLPWGLLNVSDPSSFQVLQDDTLAPDLQSVTTPGFAFSVLVAEDDAQGPGAVVAALPALKGGTLQFTRRWRWPGWEEPKYTERLKQSYGLLAAGLPGVLTDSAPRRASLDRLARTSAARRNVAARIAPFQWDRPGAVSMTFDDGSHDQFERAAPLLNRYGFKANFGLVAAWTGAEAGWHAEPDGTSFLRIGIAEAKQLIADGHRVSSHGMSHDLPGSKPDQVTEDVTAAKALLEQRLEAPVNAFHYPYSAARPEIVAAVRRAAFWFARTAGERHNEPAGFDRYRLNSFALYGETLPNLHEFTRVLGGGRGKWTILLYHHVLDPDSREMQTMARHNVEHTYSVSPRTFGRQVRLARNTGAWVAPLEDVGRYLLQYRHARLNLRRSERSAALRIDGARAAGLPLVPMTVVVDVPWRWVTVSGSEADGLYSPYDGRLLLNVTPGEEVTVSQSAEREAR
jgi:peptidoglycan/xylan/chitin deacetylase (PgdA/CDA1 family)